MTHSFEKKYRISQSKDFSSLRINPQVVNAKLLRGYFKENDHGFMRIAFAVSRKVGKAHDRNRIKRILRETFRLSQKRNKSVDVLFVVSPKSKSFPERQLLNDFNFLLRKISDRPKGNEISKDQSRV